MNLLQDFSSAMQGVSKVNLRGGVVGKVAITLIAACLSIAIVAWSFHNIWISAFALAAIFILSFTMLWRLISFADRHPQAALLEGAEFLVHEQIVQGAKYRPEIRVDPMDKLQLDSPEISSFDRARALKPDTEVNQHNLPKEGGQE